MEKEVTLLKRRDGKLVIRVNRNIQQKIKVVEICPIYFFSKIKYFQFRRDALQIQVQVQQHIAHADIYSTASIIVYKCLYSINVFMIDMERVVKSEGGCNGFLVQQGCVQFINTLRRLLYQKINI